jgi:hypothetical protein
MAADAARPVKGRMQEPEQIVSKRLERRWPMAEAKGLGKVVKAPEVSAYTHLRWGNCPGGVKARNAKGLPRLENQNLRFKRLAAVLTLDNAILRGVARGSETSTGVRGILWVWRALAGRRR